MKRLAAFFLLFACLSSGAQEVISFMPHWTPQSQFAGYYVAISKGFYDEEGLTVVLDHFGANSNETSIGQLQEGKVNIISTQLISAMVARSKGVKLVNVLQTSQQSGLMCAAHFAIDSAGSLDGRKIGRWKAGFSEICELFCYRNGISVDWIPYMKGINLYVSKAVDAILCYSYSEFLQLELATGGIPEWRTLKFSDAGLGFPEDGLYVTERYYRLHKDAVDKFVKASKRGWDYAREHPDEALDITMEFINMYRVSTNRTLQRMMLEEILRLQTGPASGKADYAPVSADLFNELSGMLFERGLIRSRPTYEEMIK